VAGDPFSVLGVSPTASAEQVRAAYRGLVKRHHPDVAAPDERAAANKRMAEINLALEACLALIAQREAGAQPSAPRRVVVSSASAQVLGRCDFHPWREALGHCGVCGEPMCAQCLGAGNTCPVCSMARSAPRSGDTGPEISGVGDSNVRVAPRSLPLAISAPATLGASMVLLIWYLAGPSVTGPREWGRAAAPASPVGLMAIGAFCGPLLFLALWCWWALSPQESRALVSACAAFCVPAVLLLWPVSALLGSYLVRSSAPSASLDQGRWLLEHAAPLGTELRASSAVVQCIRRGASEGAVASWEDALAVSALLRDSAALQERIGQRIPRARAAAILGECDELARDLHDYLSAPGLAPQRPGPGAAPGSGKRPEAVTREQKLVSQYTADRINGIQRRLDDVEDLVGESTEVRDRRVWLDGLIREREQARAPRPVSM